MLGLLTAGSAFSGFGWVCAGLSYSFWISNPVASARWNSYFTIFTGVGFSLFFVAKSLVLLHAVEVVKGVRGGAIEGSSYFTRVY